MKSYELFSIALQVITIVVSIVILMVNLGANKRENQRQRMVEIVVRQRLNDMKLLKENSSVVLTLITPKVASTYDKNDYLPRLWDAYYKTISILKINYSQDVLLKEKLHEACELACEFNLNRDIEKGKVLQSYIDELYRLISLYTYSNWVCIKKQSSGTELKAIQYKEIYDKYYPDFIETNNECDETDDATDC